MMFLVVVALCCQLSATTANNLRTVITEGKLLNEYAMISTHDSATGELREDRDKILADWTRTQNGIIVDQLDCGARALDYRPFLADDGVLYAHHGPVVIYKRMEESIREIQKWGRQNPTELVLLQLSHCVEARINNNYYADSCYDAAVGLLQRMHVPIITNDNCGALSNMTMEKALQQGNVLAIFGCSFGYWDPSLTCTSKDYICYDSWPANTSHIPWGNLERSLEQWSSFVPVDDGRLWGFGANWQSSVESVAFGTLHNSSLLQDEERSGLNAWTAQAIRDGKFAYLNQVGVDNVCNNGPEIFEAMQEYNSLA